MNYYEHHLGDYVKKARHLTMLEHGAYRMLLDLYYIHEQPLPADLKAVQRKAGARTDEEKEAVETVIREFFTLQDDGWHNSKCDKEIAKARARIDAAQENGKKGGRPKKNPADSGGQPDANPSDTGRGPETNPPETHRVKSGSVSETQPKAHQAPATKLHTPVIAAAGCAQARAAITTEMREQLMEAAGNALNVPGSPEILVMARPMHWLEIGADWDLDVLPTVRTQAAKGRPYTIRSWHYFDGPIADAMARRVRPMPLGHVTGEINGHGNRDIKASGDRRRDKAIAAVLASGDRGGGD